MVYLFCYKGGILLKSPINWYGGKYYMAKDILNLFPEHKVYCEVFGGAGHILFKKKPSPLEIYNDIHEGLYLFFKLLRDEETRLKLIERLQLTPYHRKEFIDCKDWMFEQDELEKVRKFYIRTMQSVACSGGGWSYSKSSSRRGMSASVSRWLGNVDEVLVDAVERLREIQIENLDFRECIKKYDSEDTLFYLDPPYIHETRTFKNCYDYEMSNEDHKDLVDLLLNVKGKCILSGYDHEIYSRLEMHGWKKIFLGSYAKRSVLSNTGKVETGQEFVWINYDITDNFQQLSCI